MAIFKYGPKFCPPPKRKLVNKLEQHCQHCCLVCLNLQWTCMVVSRQSEPEEIRAKNSLQSIPWDSNWLELLFKVTLDSTVQGTYAGGPVIHTLDSLHWLHTYHFHRKWIPKIWFKMKFCLCRGGGGTEYPLTPVYQHELSFFDQILILHVSARRFIFPRWVHLYNWWSVLNPLLNLSTCIIGWFPYQIELYSTPQLRDLFRTPYMIAP